MRPRSYISAILAGSLLMTNINAAQAAINAASQDLCRSRSTEILASLQKGDYAAATAHFDARLQAGLNADKLAQVWGEMLPAQIGAFVRGAAVVVRAQDGATLAETPLEFTKGWLNLRIACDADGKVGGLFFTPGSEPARESAPISSPTNETGSSHATDHPLAVSSPLGPLAGTLTLPMGDGPFPAMLLVAGSGPNDRDESIGPNKPFLDLARGLAEHGIASFRYDKRTLVYGAKMAGTAITVDDEVTDDAIVALKLLATQPQIDAKHLFVLGHSLGALMAPRICSRYPQIAGVILLAAPVTLDLNVVLRQTRYIAGLQRASSEQLQQAVAPIVVARDAIAKADPAHPPAGEFFHAPASYWLSLRDYDPVAVAEKLRQPILALQGGSDYQVTPQDDFGKWQKAFAQEPRVTLKEYAGLNHLFMQAGSPPSPADYAKAGHVDPQVIADVAQWIAATALANVH